MIAKSDLVILLVSASALGVGVARWQMNVAPDAAVRVVAPAAAPAPVPVPAAAPTAKPAVIASTPRPRADARIDDRTAALPESRIDTAPDTAPDTATPDIRVEPKSAPAPVSREPTDNPVAPASGEPLYGVYEVVSGDNLSAIALRFGTSVASLRRINALEGTTILVGQQLRYPQAAN